VRLLAIGFLFGLLNLDTAAAPVTFQYSTTVNASAFGGGLNTPLVVTYTFDSALAAGTGPFTSISNLSSYGPLSLTLSLGAYTVTGQGGGITVYNDVPLYPAGEPSYFEDGYGVRASSYQGLIDKKSVSFFRFLLVDDSPTSPAPMLSGTSLPTDPAFSLQAQYQQLEITFTDGTSLIDDEFHGTPEASVVPFTLKAVPEPSSWVLAVAAAVLFGTSRRRSVS
jgi:hypothetical protein